MNVELLQKLEEYAQGLADWTADLIEFQTNPNVIIPNQYERAEDYRVHIECMIGSYRIMLGLAYNVIPEWQDV